ncbi:hypothetical protein IE980_23355 [Klebsiella pneumoniae]|uniref:Uncharacterized protein n=1 Tax=Klebsiella pneumoniae TaxID=573 RepID=A0A927E2P1_KLEPN|nr:hypothetical protein [Klebsiella pneumoniae]
MKTAPELVELLRFFLTSQSGRHCQALLTVTPFLFDKKLFIHVTEYLNHPVRAGPGAVFSGGHNQDFTALTAQGLPVVC